MYKLKYLLLLFIVASCSDYPASEGNSNEANPININITIDADNLLNDPTDNDTQNVDINSNSSSSSDNNSSNSNSTSTIDNSTWFKIYDSSTEVTYYEFYSI